MFRPNNTVGGNILLALLTIPLINFVVDLRLHGIDEIVIQPVDGDAIRQKYSKWTSVTIVPGKAIKNEFHVQIKIG